MSDARGASILFIPHGGGPLPLLDDPGHARLSQFLRDLGKQLPRPDAILLISFMNTLTDATIYRTIAFTHPCYFARL